MPDFNADVQYAMADPTASNIRNALRTLSICRGMPGMIASYEEIGSKIKLPGKGHERVREELRRTQSACQALDGASLAAAPVLAVQYYETQTIGAAVLLVKEYPDAARAIPANQMADRIKRDAYAGHLGSLSAMIDLYSGALDKDELLGFRMANAQLLGQKLPSLRELLARMSQAVLDFDNPKARTIADKLVKAAQEFELKQGGSGG